MGDIKKKKKKFTRPRKLYDSERIKEEKDLINKYGLKNNREIWKAKSKVSRFRRMAKELIKAPVEEQEKFFDRLKKLGLEVNSIPDVLALTTNDILNLRLQTIVYKKGLALSIKQARQLIVHRHILVDGKIVTVPSFLVKRDLMNKIELKPKKIKKEQTTKIKEESD